MLDDNQLAQYEKELDLHRQRVAFVERLEMLENATIKPYEPKLEPIAIIGEIEIDSFEKPEHALTVSERAARPELQIGTFEKPEPKNLALSPKPKQPNIQIKHKRNPERLKPKVPDIGKPTIGEKRYAKPKRKRPDLPKVEKPDVAVKSFKQPEEIGRPSLPTTAKPTIRASANIAKLKDARHNAQSNMPHVNAPKIEMNPFITPEKAKPDLPVVAVRLGEMIVFCAPERRGLEIPAVVKPGIKAGYHKKQTRHRANPENSFPDSRQLRSQASKPLLSKSQSLRN